MASRSRQRREITESEEEGDSLEVTSRPTPLDGAVGVDEAVQADAAVLEAAQEIVNAIAEKQATSLDSAADQDILQESEDHINPSAHVDELAAEAAIEEAVAAIEAGEGEAEALAVASEAIEAALDGSIDTTALDAHEEASSSTAAVTEESEVRITMQVNEVERESTTLAQEQGHDVNMTESVDIIEEEIAVTVAAATETSTVAMSEEVPAESAPAEDEVMATGEAGAEPPSDASAPAEELTGRAAALAAVMDQAETAEQAEEAVEAAQDALEQVAAQATADVDVESEDEGPEIESTLPGPAHDNTASGVEDARAPVESSTQAGAVGTAAGTHPDAVALASAMAAVASVSSTDAEGEDESDDSSDSSAADENEAEEAPMANGEEEPPFSQEKLVRWADDLKGEPAFISSVGLHH